MSFEFPISQGIYGIRFLGTFFQQIKNQLADSADWIGIGVCQHSPKRGVVDVSASSFASAAMVMDVVFYGLFLRLGTVV